MKYLITVLMLVIVTGCASTGSVTDLQDQILKQNLVIDSVVTQTNKNTLTIQELDADTAKKIDSMFEKSQYK